MNGQLPQNLTPIGGNRISCFAGILHIDIQFVMFQDVRF
jgi:hypothetical protein